MTTSIVKSYSKFIPGKVVGIGFNSVQMSFRVLKTTTNGHGRLFCGHTKSGSDAKIGEQTLHGSGAKIVEGLGSHGGCQDWGRVYFINPSIFSVSRVKKIKVGLTSVSILSANSRARASRLST